MIEMIYLFLGWVLGGLSNLLLDRHRHSQRRKDLTCSVIGELEEFQYLIVTAAYLIRRKRSDVTDKFLDRLLPVVSSYRGHDKDSKLVATLRKSRKANEAERNQTLALMQDENKGLVLKQYTLPFLEAQASELSICPLDFQRRVFRVKAGLNIFNQQASYLNGEFHKTFDPAIVGGSREAVMRNLTDGYKVIGEKAEDIATAIGEIISQYGNK